MQVETPFEIDEQKKIKTFTYVDTVGRPTLLLEKSNLVDEHSQPFQVCLH